VPIEKPIRLCVRAEEPAVRALFEAERRLIALLVNASSLDIRLESCDESGSIPMVGSGYEAFVYIKEVIDLDKELARLAKEHQSVAQSAERTRGKLANKGFLEKAPEEVVRKERDKLEELERRGARIQAYLQELQG
jgi:valyl-tRNA synthetase